MPRCETHNLSYPERLGACPRCALEPDSSGITGRQREAIDTALALTEAMMNRYAIDPIVRMSVLTRLLALVVVTEGAHRDWPDLRLEALGNYNEMLLATRAQLAEAMSLQESAND